MERIKLSNQECIGTLGEKEIYKLNWELTKCANALLDGKSKKRYNGKNKIFFHSRMHWNTWRIPKSTRNWELKKCANAFLNGKK